MVETVRPNCSQERGAGKRGGWGGGGGGGNTNIITSLTLIIARQDSLPAWTSYLLLVSSVVAG